MAKRPILFGIGASIIVEGDVESGKVALMGLLHFGDQRLFAAAFLASSDHDGCAVSIVGTDEDAAISAELLKAYPDIRLDVLDQMPDVNRTVGVG